MESDKNHIAYIGEMAAELAKMARIDRLELLASLLEMAALETRSAGKKFNDAQRG